MKKHLILIIFLTLISLWPFFKKGYFESHDGEWMVIRFTAFHQELRAGQFPVRFTDRLNNSYGYPVLNFLYPLPFYLAEVPKIIGFGFINSIKIIFILSTLSSALAMYWAANRLFGNLEALSAAIIYVYIPYRFVDLYVRGSLGENLAFTFLPIILGSIVKITKGEKLFVPILAVSTALLILSHNIIAALFLPLLLILAVILHKKLSNGVLKGLIMGILASAFFWLPALYDLQFVRLSQIKVSNINDHLASLGNIISPSWGYGLTPKDSLPVQAGIVNLFILFIAIGLLIRDKNKNPVIGFLIFVYLLSIFLMLKISSHVWQIVPLIDTIQFPWRLLSIVVFATAILTAYIVSHSQKKVMAAAILITACVLSSILYTKPRVFVDRGDGYYSTNEATTTVADEYMPLWVKSIPQNRADQKIEIENAKIVTQEIKPGKYKIQTDSNQPSQVKVNTIYFPGWKVKEGGAEIPINYQNQYGLINFNLPQGEHKVIIEYTHTPVHLASEIISLLAIFTSGAYFLTLWQKRNS